MGCGCNKKRKIIGKTSSKATSKASSSSKKLTKTVSVARRKKSIAQKSRYSKLKTTALKS